MWPPLCVASLRGLGTDRQTDTHTLDTCHEKTDIKVFVVVIPKEGLAGCLHKLYSIVGFIPKDKEGLAGPQPFFVYDNGKDPKVCFLVTCITYCTSICRLTVEVILSKACAMSFKVFTKQ